MMKRILFILTLAFALLCGCVKNDVHLPDQRSGAVLFNEPLVKHLTKVHYGEISDPYPMSETFGVFGVYHPSGFNGWESSDAIQYINGAEFSYDEAVDDDNDGIGGWTGGYYFPNKGSLSFSAFSPYSAHSDSPADGTGKFTYGDDGLSIDDFSVHSDPAFQYDLMFSKRIYNKTSSLDGTDYTIYDGLDIEFQHALSSIRFSLQQKEEYPGVTLRLKSIRIFDVKYKGDFEENVQNPSSDIYASEPVWNTSEDLIAGSYYAYQQPDDEHLKLTGYYGTEGVLLLDGNMDVSANKNGQDQDGHMQLILMPQVFKNASSIVNEDASIEIVYTIQNDAGPKIPQKATVKLSSVSDQWEIGKRYTYNIVIGLHKIYFSPTVDGWEDVEVESIKV